MFRKVGLIAVILVMAYSLCMGVYADTTTKNSSAAGIEILKPEVGSEGDVILKKETLFVKVRLASKTPVYMTLYRIDPEFYLGKINKPDVKFVPSGDFDNLTEEQKLEYRRLTYFKKNAIEEELTASKAAYDEVAAAVKKAFGDVTKMEALKTSNSLTAAQSQIYEKHRKLLAEYNQKKKEYAPVKMQYDKLFTRVVYGPVEVTPLELLLTYQTEITGVKPGTYVLAFSEKIDGSGLLKTLEFKGETSEAAVEKMINTIPESRNIIFN